MQGAIFAYNLSIPLKMTLQAASDSHESWPKGMLQSFILNLLFVNTLVDDLYIRAWEKIWEWPKSNQES